jgi:serine protease Do
MTKFIGGAGPIAALAALLAAAVTAAAMLAVQPAAAQSQPRIIVQSGGASVGVSIRDVTTDDAAKAKMAQAAGVYVESVREGSPAARAGLQAGDIVVDFDGERVRGVTHFTRLVQESVPGRQVAAVVLRGTSKQTVNVVPEASGAAGFLSGDLRPRLQEQLPRNFNFNFEPDVLRPLPLRGGSLGVTVSPLSEQLAGYFGVKQGVLVTDVSSSSPAAAAGVRAGDVITAINGQAVSNGGEVNRVLRENRNESVELSVTRDRKSLSLKATVPARNVPGGRSGRSGFPV